MKIIYFHRNNKAGFSINKVTQTIIRDIDNKKEYYMPCSGSGLRALLRNILFIIKYREKGAIHHITGDVHYGILGLIGYKSVLTIHDTVGLDFLKMGKIKSFIYGLIWFRLPLLLSSRIVCISEVTRSYLWKYSKRTDIRVIHNAIDSKLEYSSMHSMITVPNILFIGIKDNKNLIRCFEALNGISCRITVIGKLKDNQIESLKANDIDYINKWDLSDDELNQEYMKCDIVSFCSLFEGFGMPVLEANKAGRPVLCSTIPVLKEVAGEAACFVDPYDIEDIRRGYLHLINDQEYRKELVDKGVKNVLKYQPTIIRNQWQEVYSSLE